MRSTVVAGGGMPAERRSPTSVTDRLVAAVAHSLPGRVLASGIDRLRGRVVPNHWSSLFGVVSLACVVVLFVTGLFLMFFFVPSSETVVYGGHYAPLRGAEMAKALQSTLRISFEVRGGLLMRQAHHWAALLLPASLIMQLLMTFFTGAFRNPRQWSWVALFLLFVTALIGGWSGYGLPDDLLSGTGLQIAQGVALGIPFVGSWAAWLLFGGNVPGEVVGRLYPLHVAIVPAVLIALLAVRLVMADHLKPAQFPGAGRTERNVVGIPLLPTAASRAAGLLAMVIGVLLALGAVVTIDPVWAYGPASPSDATAGSQPDWYTGFLDGALRLVPPGWEFVWLDHTWTAAILVPLAAVTTFLVLVAAYPFLEAWATGDATEHHLLDRPRDTPTRTAVGVAGIVFFGVLWGAGSADLIATTFGLSIEGIVTTLQFCAVVGPPAAFAVARRFCLGLQHRDREIAVHGPPTGRIVRLPGGEYMAVHRAGS